MDEGTARSRHPDPLGEALLWALLPTLALLLIAPAVSDAQVTTNITHSDLPSCPGPCGIGVTIVDPPSPGGTVTTITGGARPGDGLNLFHSFGRFDVGPGDIANFLNETHLPTSNILSRVTGGNPSQIYGTIQTTDFPGANLFLINPAGVLFGATAVLDLGAVTGSAIRQPGSFYATTADYIKQVDANGTSLFYAAPAQTSVLSVAPVAAFGFTATNPVSITIEGSTLMVGQAQTLTIIGGNTPFNKTIQETPVLLEQPVPSGVTVTGGTLSAPGGQIQVVSVASPGEVLVPSLQTAPNINGASFTTMGTVTLESAFLDVSGQLLVDVDGNPIGGNSGTVFVRGGQLAMMDSSFIYANTAGSVDGAPTAVDIQVSHDIALTDNSSIITNTDGTGKGGEVHLTADTLTMANVPFAIFTGTGGGGVGGDVVLNVGTVSLMGASSILSSNQNANLGSGRGGNVIIQGLPGVDFGASTLVTLSDGSSLLSQTFQNGDGGRVEITATSLKMDGNTTTVNTTANNLGHGGEIVVGVQEAHLTNGATITTLTVSADPSAPTAATVTIQGLQGAESMAGSVALSGAGSGIVSDTQGHGRSGEVVLQAKTINLTDGAVIQAGTLNTTGAGGDVKIVAESVDISGGSRISSQARLANAGQVTITANELTLDNASIVTNTLSSGLGGKVVLDVGSVSLSSDAKINSSASGTGQAGDITMTGGGLTLANHAEITSSSTGTVADAGDAGKVTITSSGAFTSNASTIATSAENARGGNIEVTAQSVALSNGAVMSASSRSPLLPEGAGNAGNIRITSDSNFVMQNSSVTTEASHASGGSIEIDASDAGMVQLVNSQVSTSVGGSVGLPGASDGGNINIDPQFVVLQNSQILAQANAGAGGAIDIIATSAYIKDPASIVSASSTLGISGTVNIQSPLQNVGGELTALSQEFSSAAALLAQQCAARAAGGTFSTFVVAAREGLPVEPGGFLASPSLTAELLGSRLSGRDAQTQLSVVTGLFPQYDARPIQLAKFGGACR